MAAKDSARKPAKKKKKILRRILLWLLILLVLAGAGLYAWSSLQAEFTITYQEYTATTGSISNSLSFNGTLQTVNSENHYANNDSTVKAIYVTPGQDVKKGTKLMRLSSGQTLTADIDGTVNQLAFKVGDNVKADDLLCDVIDFTHMKVNIRIDEYDINDVVAGNACRITTVAGEKTFDSVIDSINHISSSTGNVAYYTGVAYVDVTEGIYPGMQVSVTIPKNEVNDVVILKMDAISADFDNSSFVYVKNEEDEVTKKPIKTGVSNGSYVEITEGLASGDVVYVEVKNENTNALTGMLSGLFGRQNFRGSYGSYGSGNRTNNNNSSSGSFGGDMPGGFTPPSGGNFGSGGSSSGGSRSTGGSGGSR